MFPTDEQIAVAAYHRWHRGGAGHGADVDDWTAAEQDLLFALNYEVVGQYRLDEPEPRLIGDGGRRVCRFCEQSAPQTTFAPSVPAVPATAGNRSLRSLDECDECHALFDESLGADLASFLGTPGPWQRPSISPGAYKALVKVALTLMPRADLNYFTAAIDWVLNPDHDLDGASFAGLGCQVHQSAVIDAPAWAALARRTSDDGPFPYAIFFLGTAGVAFVLAVPLGNKDEDFDGETLLVPRVAAPDGLWRGRGRDACRFVPIEAPAPLLRTWPRLGSLLAAG